jgi:hypothetical protein
MRTLSCEQTKERTWKKSHMHARTQAVTKSLAILAFTKGVRIIRRDADPNLRADMTTICKFNPARQSQVCALCRPERLHRRQTAQPDVVATTTANLEEMSLTSPVPAESQLEQYQNYDMYAGVATL